MRNKLLQLIKAKAVDKSDVNPAFWRELGLAKKSER
jgi:hypothetical protein